MFYIFFFVAAEDVCGTKGIYVPAAFRAASQLYVPQTQVFGQTPQFYSFNQGQNYPFFSQSQTFPFLTQGQQFYTTNQVQQSPPFTLFNGPTIPNAAQPSHTNFNVYPDGTNDEGFTTFFNAQPAGAINYNVVNPSVATNYETQPGEARNINEQPIAMTYDAQPIYNALPDVNAVPSSNFFSYPSQGVINY